ncbi:hypothetical protein [Rhodopirellula sp. MGV]|uniref:hypothetical protein n=1 Tax=Rhodopirellula sp. MGV TaxID=2023130 RepID=UPI000B977843|nr:hypothetical protein [Rhodopirellula sp. MGV]OYP34497.1 hypothetical protein CGZ80_14590 [Rhodopirellula sp. MGV]PNY36890.1 hypothetical protein C2E31_10550 [Rhodopirellula baltica]PNY37230.1 hypothetical protein C2E31_08705 [Rhodopirellula baltica]
MKFLALFACLIANVASPASVLADAVQIIDAPTTYVSGDSLEFTVSVPAMTNLSSYQIDILLSSNFGSAGVDYSFGTITPASPGLGYVFESNDFFGTGFNLESASTQRLSLSDFDLAGINTFVGVNDYIATVQIDIARDFSGPLQLSIDASRLIFDGPDLTPTPVAEFDAIQNATFSRPVTLIAAVPEPSNAIFIIGGLSSLGFRRHKRTKF